MKTRLEIEGLEVLVEGEGTHAVLMLNGWPDSPALWDDTVAALRDGYRCVRFSLPGYELGKPPRAMPVSSVNVLIRRIVDTVSPNDQVTLLLHDWGCFFGYEFTARHMDRVARVVGVDIGDTSAGAYRRSLSAKQKGMIAGYQIWLALAWKLGPVLPGLANRMTRYMARQIGCRNPPEQIAWQMNYPYAMLWLGEEGGLRGAARVDRLLGIKIPALFIYGRRKPFMFHSEDWVAQLQRAPGCEVLALDTGHWVMRQKPAEFNACVRAWLDISLATA
ncbi:alpha/beta fold hydrolase [Hydrogenophaga sp. BPS33]|uniref:alpha/beta fold hydrolase n=1 Tax=Hydrogenophaga sp. BPS33 TaxID=2651974 RepID=UPI001320019D|nr:alpha/beta hydrolase [Hydrogenophaga sp. BPS33]QHE85669.1 alpha/beta hydrolase [Hydrogenophaga sp. BPS33]